MVMSFWLVRVRGVGVSSRPELWTVLGRGAVGRDHDRAAACDLSSHSNHEGIGVGSWVPCCAFK
jgi:hypothetical protein